MAPIRHLDAIDVRMTAAQGCEACIELRHARSARPAVEVRHAEPIPTPLEVAVEQKSELAQMEDRLGRDGPGPLPRPEPRTECRRDALELSRLVLEHPAGRVESDEEARMWAPASRSQTRPLPAGADGRRVREGGGCFPRLPPSVGGDARRLELGSKALEVRVDEKLHEPVEVERRRPPEALACLRRIPDEVVELRLPTHQ